MTFRIRQEKGSYLVKSFFTYDVHLNIFQDIISCAQMFTVVTQNLFDRTVADNDQK